MEDTYRNDIVAGTKLPHYDQFLRFAYSSITWPQQARTSRDTHRHASVVSRDCHRRAWNLSVRRCQDRTRVPERLRSRVTGPGWGCGVTRRAREEGRGLFSSSRCYGLAKARRAVSERHWECLCWPERPVVAACVVGGMLILMVRC